MTSATPGAAAPSEWLECVTCKKQYDATLVRYACDCSGLLSVERPPGSLARLSPKLFDLRRAYGKTAWEQSGVWRYREAVMTVSEATIVAHPEGATRLYWRDALDAYAGVEGVRFKHEGENPTGSFKDRGMTVATTAAVRAGAVAVACASTGNTSASLAAYAAQAKKRAIVFLPEGKVSTGKLAQTLAYGALCLQVRGDFDAAMKLVDDAAKTLGLYLLNSKNPFRIEGQKTIVWELLHDLSWDAPDWIVVPAGNLGNTSAFGKALKEAAEAGWIAKVPRLLSVQARGANPFFKSFAEAWKTRHKVAAETVATAIRIGDPVSYEKARAAIDYTRGVVTEVSDEELLLAKRAIDAAGIGCEPASACTLAGLKQQVAKGVIKKSERVVCVLTGNLLKDTSVIVDAPGITPLPMPLVIDPTIDAVRAAAKL